MISEKKLPELLENIDPHYHKAFQKAFSETLYAGETALFAADFCSSQMDGISSGEFGVTLFTDRSCIQYKNHTEGRGIVYLKEKGSLSDFMDGKNKTRRWVDLERSFKAGRQLELPNIFRKDYSEIQGMIPQYYQVTDRNQTYDLLELKVEMDKGHISFGDYLVFKKGDGEMALQLFLQAQSQNGEITTSSVSASQNSIEDLLNSLDRLHKSGILTDAEYSQKKQEILARM